MDKKPKMRTTSDTGRKRSSRAKSESTKLTPKRLKDLCLLPEDARTAGPERELCVSCNRAKGCPSPYVREAPAGWNARLLLLFGQRPSQEALDYVVSIAKHHGYEDRDIWFFDAVACGGRKPTTNQLRACRPFLVHFINRHKPRHILAFGDVALRYVTDNSAIKNITAHRGVPFMTPGCEHVRSIVYGTYDPESIIDGAFFNGARIEEDVRRTLEGTRGLPRLSEPTRGLSISSKVGVDTEFMPDGRVITIAASNTVNAAVADVSSRAESKRILGTIDGSSVFIGHQVSVDLDSVLRLVREFSLKSRKLETWLQGKNILDTLALARMVDENRPKGGYKLEVLLRSNHRVDGWKDDNESRDLSNPELWDKDYRLARCRLDAWATACLGEELSPIAAGPVEFTHRIIQTLRRIFHAGAYVDLDYAKGLTSGFYKEASKAKHKLLAHASQAGMTEFEPTNDNHIRELLFDRMGITSTEKTKTGQRSVNKTFLKTYQHEDVVKTLLEFNTHDKRHSTYGAGLAEKFLATSDPRRGLLRIRINPLGARTGRRASDKPNTQNWPKDVRKIIVSRFPGGCISDNDYSKLEVVLFAWTAKEWKLLEFFLDEGNGYIKVGRELFGKEVKEDTDDYRTVKSIVLGIQYGMGAYKLAYQLWNNVGVKFSSDWEEHVEQAARLRQRYLDKFPGIPRYIWNQKRALLRDQAVRSLTGRVRHLPCPFAEETPGFGHLLNQAINFPIQSLASDVTGSAMVDVEAALLEKYKLTYEEYHWRLMEGTVPDMPLLINEVHDDLVYDMPPKGLTDNLEMINEIMADVPTLRELVPEFDVPLRTGQKAGSRWGLDDREGK